MLLPKFDILNKIKKERTITLANAIIIAFAALLYLQFYKHWE